MSKETNFPRGKGLITPLKSDNKTKKRKRNNDEELFKIHGKNEDTAAKSKRRKNKKDKNDDDDVKIVIETMTVSRLPEGINIFGCIHMITDYELRMSLCGGIIAKVPITNISDSYTQLLETVAYNSKEMTGIEVLKPNGMFQIGQYFPVKIMSKIESEGFGMTEVIASLNPKDIYSDVKALSMIKIPKMNLVAAVISIEDHGYIMDIGFNDIKAFLSHDKAQNAIQLVKGRKSLAIGQLIMCSIDSVVNDRSVTLSTNNKNLNSKITDDMSVPLSCLIPGSVVSVTVMDVTERGLELNVITDFNGFVHRHHLKSLWEIPKKNYSIGQKMFGTILYVHPITKQIAVSLRLKMDPSSVRDFWSRIKVGTIINNAIVVGKENGGVLFKLPGDFKGLASKNHIFDKNLNDDDDYDMEIDSKFPIGSKHRCRIKSINYLDSLVKVTLKPSILERSTVSIDDLLIGSIIKGTVKKLTSRGVWLQIGFGLKGFVPDIHLTEAPITKHPHILFPLNKEVKCRVLKIDKSLSPPRISLTCKKSLLNENLNLIQSYNRIKFNTETDGVIVLVKNNGLLIEFFNNVKGWIPLRLMSDYNIKDAAKVFQNGQIIQCSVVNSNPDDERMTLSLTKIQNKHLKDKAKDISLKQNGVSIKQLSIGSIINGKVEKLTHNGVILKLGPKLNGFIPELHFSDDSIDNPKKHFSHNKEVKCRVVKLDKNVTPPKVSLTCKESLLSDDLNIVSDYKHIETNSNIQTHGVVVLVKKKGILLEFFNNIKGWIPIRCMSACGIKFPEDTFKRGQIVHCAIESFEKETNRITCSLINSNFNLNESVKMSDKTNNKVNDAKEHAKEVPNIEKHSEDNKTREKRTRYNSLNSDSDLNEEALTKLPKNILKTKASLSIEGFKWDIDDATPNLTSMDTKVYSSSDSESDDEDNGKSAKRKTRKERNDEVRQREEQLRNKEKSLMDTDRTPETVDDFERSVLSSPNSSLVWIQYMSFHLEQAEIDKARAVGARALKVISFREEQEKLNVWVAILNMENLYGTETSLDETFKNAIQNNEPIKVYTHLAMIYAQTDKHEQAEALYHTMIKKFKNDPSVWIDFGLFYMKWNRPESARKLMQRSLTGLEKRHHVEVISKFGQLEFKYGDIERGKTIFENILATYTKRIDLWSVYLDLMIKYGAKGDNSDNNTNIDAIRQIYERLITHKFPARKMKFIFKRYIDFENQFGTEDRVNRIKQKAIEYVEAKTLD